MVNEEVEEITETTNEVVIENYEEKDPMENKGLVELIIKRVNEDEEEIIVTANAVVIENYEEEDSMENKGLVELMKYESEENIDHTKIENNLGLENRQELRHIMMKYESIFTDTSRATNLTHYATELTTEEPIRSKAYIITYALRVELKDEIKKMLDMRIIRESTSLYALQIIIAIKREDFNQICVELGKINKVKVFDPGSITTTEKLFSQVEKSECFTKVDSSKDYWKIPMRKNTFMIRNGYYEFMKIPFRIVDFDATLIEAIRKI